MDLGLAAILGLADGAARAAAVDLAPRPLARLQLGALQLDQVSPVLTVDAGVIRRVTGQPVLGLLGQAVLSGRAIVVDYAARTLVLVPARPDSLVGQPGFRSALSPGSVAVPFRMVADGKALIRVGVVAGPGRPRTELSLIVDTGATKTVLFRSALDRHLPGWRSWPALRGLGAPTLTGDAAAELVRVPRLEVVAEGGVVGRSGVDAAVIGGDLPGRLESSVREPVDGLLGYSFLKHFRIALDYPSGLLWLDPETGDVPDRPTEYCHPGIQLESVAGSVRVMAVADGSPASQAGIRPGDELLSVDGFRVAASDVVEASRRLEGDPGTKVVLRLRRGSREWSKRVVRTPLL
ncbi:MAG: PDZ domain-containing protein [Candidatus Fermentibacter sp.]|nr:PDZ domain-containing protein [Candidatus Fermentibacter sp.]